MKGKLIPMLQGLALLGNIAISIWTLVKMGKQSMADAKAIKELATNEQEVVEEE